MFIYQAPGMRPGTLVEKIVAPHKLCLYTARHREQKTDFHDPDD